MRSRLRWQRALCAILSGSALALVPSPMAVRAGTMTGAATEWTQVLNNVALLQQIIHAIKAVVQLKRQVEYMGKSVADFKSLARGGDVDAILSGFDSVLGQTQGIMFAGQSLLEQWKKLHPGQVPPAQLAQVSADSYRQLDKSLQTSVEKSMRVLDLQKPEDDRKVFEQLRSRMDSVEGQLQAAKAGNELLLEIVRQLVMLREVVIAQANMMGEDVSAEAQRRQFDDAVRERAKYTGKYRALNPIDFSER